MKKSENLSAEPQKQSEKIAGLISQTQQHLAALDQELVALDSQRDLLVGAETLDQEALTSLCTRQAAAVTEQGALTRRIEVLAEQKVGAERQEAALRIQAIIAETERLVESHDSLQSAYARAVDALTETVATLTALHKQHRECVLEALF